MGVQCFNTVLTIRVNSWYLISRIISEHPSIARIFVGWSFIRDPHDSAHLGFWPIDPSAVGVYPFIILFFYNRTEISLSTYFLDYYITPELRRRNEVAQEGPESRSSIILPISTCQVTTRNVAVLEPTTFWKFVAVQIQIRYSHQISQYHMMPH